MKKILETTVTSFPVARHDLLFGGKRKAYDLVIQLIYPIADFTTMTFAIMVSYTFYRILGIGENVYYDSLDIFSVSLLSSLVIVILLFNFGAYKKESSLLNVEEIKNVVKGISFGFLVLMVILVFGKFQLSRYVLFFSWLFSIILVTIERTAFYHLLPSTNPVKNLNKRILIYGSGELGKALFRAITNSPKLGILPMGFIDDSPSKVDTIHDSCSFSNTSRCLAVLGPREDIRQLIKDYHIDEICVAISNIDDKGLRRIFGLLQRYDVKVSFVPNLRNVFIHKVKIDQIGQIPIVQNDEGGIAPLYRYIKKHLDLFMAIAAIIVAAPVFLIIALAIKLDSKGPVFFKQKRVGLNGNLFKIYKFRSMTTESNPYAVNPLDKNDSRITRVGWFLRKTSFDELPQIINILKGDMSFVGPRPEMPFIVDTYNDIHKERLRILPGLTGLWQLSGDRKRAMHENMDYDLYYIRNCSFFLDVVIFIETIIFAFKGI